MGRPDVPGQVLDLKDVLGKGLPVLALSAALLSVAVSSCMEERTFPFADQFRGALVGLMGGLEGKCESMGTVLPSVQKRKLLFAEHPGMVDFSEWICTAVEDGYKLTVNRTAFSFEGVSWNAVLDKNGNVQFHSDGFWTEFFSGPAEGDSLLAKRE
ncbi:hypothetical protein IPG41_01180 [Candidatus Peregrinibacteria bacterium]|nr:MAG: hypothetical protein IPG41_01180 [Candidatus Peregrinibacteria bacterium]